MLSVMIVDDEKWICELIRQSVDWDELGMEVTGVAHNGSEALAIMSEHNMDIVISDIRMPGMDGLDLIRTAQEKGFQSRFIIISGYQDFEYAKSALQSRAANYILKPVDEDELTLTLFKLREEIGALKMQERQKVQFAETKGKLREQFIRMLAKEDKVIDKGYVEEMNAGAKSFLCVAFRLDPSDPKNPDETIFSILAEQLAQTVDLAMKDCRISAVSFLEENAVFYVLEFHRDTDAVKVLKNCFPDIRLKVNAYRGYKLTMGIGTVVNDLENLHHSYLEADCAVKYRLIAGTDKMIESEKLNFIEKSISGTLSMTMRNRLVNLCEAGNEDGLREWIDEFLEFENIGGINPQIIYDRARAVLSAFLDAVHDHENDLELLMKEVSWADSLSTLKETLKRIMGRILLQKMKQHEHESSKPVAIAKDYITQHYKEDIVLSDAADRVFLNPNYLSALFKKETGSTFLNYLQNYRIEIAKQLLKETAKKVSAIAEEVGYRDTGHFTKLFKKYTTLTPAEYRKLYT